MVEAVITLIFILCIFVFFPELLIIFLGFMLISAGLPNSFHRMSVIILIGKNRKSEEKKSIYLQFFNYKSYRRLLYIKNIQ